MWLAKLLLLQILAPRGLPFKVTNRKVMQQYCDLDPENTPCLHCNISRACDTDRTKFQVMQGYNIAAILKKHNGLRESVKKMPGLGPATHMHIISWDQEAEFLASCHAMQCLPEHDKKRLSVRGGSMGQNMFHAEVKEPGGTAGDWCLKAITSWVSEIDGFEDENFRELFEPYSHNRKKTTDNLSQMLWAATKFIGCAYYGNTVGKTYNHFFFCNYYPAGNVEGQVMYERGNRNCKKPPRKFPHLCGKDRPVHKDNFSFPIEFPIMGNYRRGEATRSLKEISGLVLALSFTLRLVGLRGFFIDLFGL